MLAVFASLTVSLFQISVIREDMRGLRGDFRDGMRGLRANLNTLTGKVLEIDGRLTRIEECLGNR
jgi:hypothetical protein